MKNVLKRHYDKLTPEERFRLDVLATAWGGRAGIRAARLELPAGHLHHERKGLHGALDRAENITLRIAVPLMQELGRLRVVDAFRVLAPYQDTLNENLALNAYFKGYEAGSHHDWNYAGKTGHPPASPKWVPRRRSGSPKGTRRTPHRSGTPTSSWRWRR